MSALPQQPMTAEQYLAFERHSEIKHEFYQGELFVMAGASPNHVLMATNISTSLNNPLEERPCRVFQSASSGLSVGVLGGIAVENLPQQDV